MGAELEFIQGSNAGRKFALDGIELTVGRDAQAGLVLAEPAVSRMHAKFTCQSGAWSVSDLGSANGTLVNGARIGSAPVSLNLGDTIQLGPVVLRYQDSAASAEPTQAWSGPAFGPAPVLAQQAPSQPTYIPPPSGSEPVAFSQPMPVQYAPPQPYGAPTQQQPMIMIQGGRNLTWLWVFLCLVALGPCGLLCLGALALAILPYALVIGGLTCGCVGVSLYRRYNGYPGWERQATRGLALGVGGFAAMAVGCLLLVFTFLNQRKNENEFPGGGFPEQRSSQGAQTGGSAPGAGPGTPSTGPSETQGGNGGLPSNPSGGGTAPSAPPR